MIALLLAAAPLVQAPAVSAEAAVVAEIEERARALLADLVGPERLPGVSAALVLPDGRTVAIAVGLASRDDEAPLETDHRLLAGSTGKTYVAAAALRLAAAGELDLDRRAADWLADEAWFGALPNADAVTLRQLLRHQSGMPRYVFAPTLWESLRTQPERVWAAPELLAFVAGAEPLFGAGEGWAYADTNYLVVGQVLEAITGEPFPAHARRVLLDPLELADTIPQDGFRLERVAQGHVVMGQQMGLGPRTQEDGRFLFNVQFEGCGGGWAATPTDLARWARALWSGAAFEGDYLGDLLATVPAEALGPGRAYGLGTIVTPTDLGPLQGHDGFMPGYLTAIGWFPEHEIAVALQTNTDDASSVERPLHAVLVELAQIAIDGPPAAGVGEATPATEKGTAVTR